MIKLKKLELNGEYITVDGKWKIFKNENEWDVLAAFDNDEWAQRFDTMRECKEWIAEWGYRD